jgi:capsular exopolysaccharide synthesis family protein
MSTNDNLTPSDENSSEQAITIQPSGITAYPGSGDWMPANGNEPGKEGAGGLAVLHAVRRHWLLISSTGLACAVVTFFVLFFWVFLPQYKATGLLQLAPSNPKVLTTVAGDQQITGEFDIFRENQAALMKSEIVITAALRDERLKTNLRRQQEDERHNGIAWLTSQIQVDFPSKNAGIMQVSVREPDKKEAADIANAVVEAYLEVVVNRDRRQRRDRLDELTKIATEKEIEVHRKRDDLKRDLENIGVGDEQNVASRTSLAQNMYVEYQRQFLAMKSENRMLQSKLQVSTQTLKELEDANIKDTEKVPEMEVVMLLNNNPVYRDLQSRVAMLEQIYNMHIKTAQMAQPGMSQNPGFARTMAEREATKNQLELLKAESRELVRNAKVIELKREISRLTHQVDISDRELQGFEKQVENKQKEAENVGRISVSIQMERAEVENIERILKTVAGEREHLNVELKSVVERVTVPSGNPHEAAAVPEAEDGFWLRVMKIGFGSVLAMFLPVVGIVIWDLRKERINSVGDVSKRLKIPVIGAVPMIPPPVMRRLGDTTPKSQIWKMRFTESVDGVAARLLRKAEGDQTRVVLITSALSGEGKTTLATQLAMSLARSQRKAVLVDFDLRQPRLDGAMGLPRGPGICEALRGEGDVMDMVQQTETECLSVVTAGSWDRQVLVALSNGTVGSVLEQLRTNFDFVIIDSSPLLPIVDTRLVCQHVDAVVLSVFRDVSQGSKVLAAQEMLDAFGVRSVEAVVTGGEQHGNAKNLAYQAATLDEQVPSAETENVK